MTNLPDPVYIPIDETGAPVSQPAKPEASAAGTIPTISDEAIEYRPEDLSFGEAPALVYTTLTGNVFDTAGQLSGTVQFNVTQRAHSAEEAIDLLVSACNYAARKYGLTAVRPAAQPAPVRPAAPATPAAPAARAAQPPAPAASSAPATPATPAAPVTPAAPAQQNTGETSSFYAVQMKVTLREDSRIDLSWMIEGHTYPDITFCCTPAKACELLAATGAWQADHFARPATFSVRHEVVWKQGKPNRNGGFFKDIVKIQPF